MSKNPELETAREALKVAQEKVKTLEKLEVLEPATKEDLEKINEKLDALYSIIARLPGAAGTYGVGYETLFGKDNWSNLKFVNVKPY